MTAHALQSDRERCLAAGMDGYLCKPVQRQELIETVERMGLGIKDEGLGMSDEGMMRDEGIRMSDEGSAMQEAGIRTHPSSLIAHPSSLAPHRASLPFDLDAALALFDGRIELFNDMVGFFFSDGMKVLPEIRAAAAASDAKTVEKKAHRLKGTVLYLGAKAAVESLARVESLGRSRDLAQAAAAIASMEEEITRLATALRPYE
jgi:HPt (histidine-containing phosphotransfer) domain-containing protein